jgi:hypothetical protein
MLFPTHDILALRYEQYLDSSMKYRSWAVYLIEIKSSWVHISNGPFSIEAVIIVEFTLAKRLLVGIRSVNICVVPQNRLWLSLSAYTSVGGALACDTKYRVYHALIRQRSAELRLIRFATSYVIRKLQLLAPDDIERQLFELTR